MISIIISNWYFIVLIPLIAFASAYLYTHRIPDVYAAKCQILLKTNETYDYQQQIYRGLGFGSKYASYEHTASQMRVIKSSNLIEEVLDALSLNVSYFIVGRLKITEVYEHMPFRVLSDERSSAHSGMSFNLNIIDENSYLLKYEKNGVEHEKQYKFEELILDDGLYLKVTKQSNLNELSIGTLSQINYLFKVFHNNSLLSKYKSGIEVKNLDYTSIVEVMLKDEISERAVEVLDTLAKVYVENTVKSQREINENTLNYIDRQLNEVIGIINEIESELEVFKEKKSILNLSKEEETYFGRFVELDNEVRFIERELESIDELNSYLLQNENVESLLPPSVFVNDQDPKLRDQISQLYEARSEYNNLRESGTTENPLLQSLEMRIKELKTDILLYLDNRATALQKRKEESRKQINEYETRIKRIPKTQREILNIERRLAVNEELYSFLLSKRAETVIAKAGLVPETKIIEKARPVGVVYPDKWRMNLIATLVGIGLAIIIVIVRTLFFQKISTVGQLQTNTSISILGSVPRVPNFSKTYRIRSGSERSEVVQAFRSLRTNLQYFSRSDKSTTSVLITSLLPGEGKTFTSVNLASVLAIAEKRVLIIDFDLHKPRLAKAMGLENNIGVSNFLIGQSKIESIVQNTDVPSLDVITSGPIPPNASELLLRPELREIFKYAEENYEYVLLDTPPVSLITDAAILMKSVEIKLFVLNSKSTSKTSIDYIEQMIDRNELEGCALVLNEEKVSRLNYYYSKYGYGGYGYGGYAYGGYGEDYKS